MKNFIVLFSFLLTSCGSCLIGQIPPQTLFPGVNCTATVPDYRPYFNVTGGCTGVNVTQSPAPGTILTVLNSPMTVIVKATSKTNGKFDQRSVLVNFADTITPKMVPTGILAEVLLKQLNEIYDAGDKLIAWQDRNLMSQSWIDSIPGLREKLRDSSYYKQMLVVTSFQKPSGERSRLITFADSVLTINKYK